MKFFSKLGAFFFSKNWRDSRSIAGGMGGFLFALLTAMQIKVSPLGVRLMGGALALVAILDNLTKLLVDKERDKNFNETFKNEKEKYFDSILTKILNKIKAVEGSVDKNVKLKKIKHQLEKYFKKKIQKGESLLESSLDAITPKELINDIYKSIRSPSEIIKNNAYGFFIGISTAGNHFIELNLIVAFGNVIVFKADEFKPIYSMTLALAAFSLYHGLMSYLEMSNISEEKKLGYIFNIVNRYKKSKYQGAIELEIFNQRLTSDNEVNRNNNNRQYSDNDNNSDDNKLVLKKINSH